MTKKIQSMVIIAMFAAIISIVSVIPTGIYIMGIPVTLQTFACFLAGYVLGCRNGVRAVIIYILLGLVGLPVFSGFKGGPGVLLSVTGGYIVGFIVIAMFAGMAKKRENVLKVMAVSFMGLVICYIIGTIWFSFVSKTAVNTAFMVVTLPCLPKDVLSMVAAYMVGKKMDKSLKYIKRDI